MTQQPTFPAQLHTTPVKDHMTPRRALTTHTHDTPALTICDTILTHGHTWILDDADTLTGIITTIDTLPMFTPPAGTHDYDIPSPKSLSYGLALTAADIMTSRPTTIRTTDPLSHAATLMKELHINQLPVVDDTNKLLGEITSDQILRLYLTTQHAPTDQ